MKAYPRSTVARASLVGVMLGCVVSSCRDASPTRPSPHSPAGVASAGPGAAASEFVFDTSTTWSCMVAAGSTTIFLPAGCPARRISLSALGAVEGDAPPSAPLNLSGSASGSTVTLNWSAPISPDLATSYIVEAGSSPGASNLVVFDTASTATTLTAADVPAGTYFLRVRAKNSSGVSTPSNEIAITVSGGTPCIPGPPTGLSASVNGTSVAFTWTAPGGVCAPIGYNLIAGSSPGASNLANVAVDAASTSFAATGVPLGTYFVRVVSRSSSGPGGASNEVIVSIVLRGDVSDPIGDAVPVPNVASSPDLVNGTADVRGDGNVTFTVRLAPGTFDPRTTLLIIYLDTDQNVSTGIPGGNGLGMDYLVSMFGQNLAIVQRSINQVWTTVAQVPMTAVVNGRDIAVPLTLLGNDDGRLNYKVSSFSIVANTAPSGILDTMPNVGLPPGRVQ